MPGSGFGDDDVAPLARGTPNAGIPMLDVGPPQPSTPGATKGGDLDFVVREDVDLEAPSKPAPRPAPRPTRPTAKPAPAPADDLPLMDFDLPVPAESTSGVRGSHAEPDLEMLELTEPEVDEVPAGAIEPELHPSTAMAAQSVELLQAMADSDPDDPGVRRRLAEAMLDAGNRDGGLRELEAAMISAERGEDLDSAASLADEIVRLDPSSVRHHQKRVEYAFRLNERGRLIDAYLELADALFRAGQMEKSRAIYQRVLDLAPQDVRAQAALESFPTAEAAQPPAPAAPRASAGRPVAGVARGSASPSTRPEVPVAAGDDLVNLGEWLRGDETQKSTRMVVPEQEPTGDEEADFQDMLRKFKQGIAENIDEEDHQSHYDLGVAYKEMGLVDEAIAEFQKALRAPTNRVPTYEALGACFIEKEQYAMAATLLARALTEKGVTDDSLVGVLYLLGRCAEARGQHDAALEYYQRVFVVDIQFRDVGERMAAVEGGRA